MGDQKEMSFGGCKLIHKSRQSSTRALDIQAEFYLELNRFESQLKLHNNIPNPLQVRYREDLVFELSSKFAEVFWFCPKDILLLLLEHFLLLLL